MAKLLSEDLRPRVVRAVEDGMGAARQRSGSESRSRARYVFVKEWRESGAIRVKRLGGDQRSQRIEEHHGVIMTAIEAKPDMTLVEIAEMLKSKRGDPSALSLMLRFFDRHGVTFKKKRACAEQDRPDVAAAPGLARIRAAA